MYPRTPKTSGQTVPILSKNSLKYSAVTSQHLRTQLEIIRLALRIFGHSFEPVDLIMLPFIHRETPRSRVAFPLLSKRVNQKTYMNLFWKRMRTLGCLFGALILGLSYRPVWAAAATPATSARLSHSALRVTAPASTSVVITTPCPLPVEQATDDGISESEVHPDAESEAPSVVWLIVMPAVPVVGGGLIYLSRRLLGKPSGECRLITQAPPKQPLPPDPVSSEKDQEVL